MEVELLMTDANVDYVENLLIAEKSVNCLSKVYMIFPEDCSSN